jgi:hypothetical protein
VSATARRLSITWLAGLAGAAAWPGAAAADIDRFALVIGNNVGDGDEVELRYAEEDAEKVHDVLRDLGGFRPENMVLLRGDSADAARRALISLNGRIRRESSDGRPSAVLFVYYSGHADTDTLHMGDGRFELRQLEELVEGSAAGFRILVLDACRSGALTRVKGGQLGPPRSIALRDRLSGEGTVFLTATSANEDAQESDEIKGSFFTHYLVSGLVGAADASGDGQVVLEEAYRYAYDRTLRASSRTLAGTQHPTFRYDLRGQGQIVLTRIVAERRAIVDFPAGRSYLLFRDGQDGPLVAEVGGHDAMRRISVRPGRYFVRGRATRYLLEGTVDLARDSARTITDAELGRIDYARFVRKGAGDVGAVHGPLVGFSARASLFEAGACAGPYAGYALETRELTLTPRFGLCSAGALGDPAGGRELSAELRLSREWDLPWLTVGLGILPGLALLADSSAVDGSVLGGYRAVAMLGTSAAATLELYGSSYASLELGAQTYIQRKRILVYSASATSQDPPLSTENQLDAAVVVRAGFGVGVRW